MLRGKKGTSKRQDNICPYSSLPSSFHTHFLFYFSLLMSSLFCLPSFGSKMLPLIQPNVSEHGFGEEGAFERFA